MLETFANTFRIPDLRRKILITLALLCICRVGVYIPIPGVNLAAAQAFFKPLGSGDGGAGGGIMAMIDMFSGGALRNCAVFGLGIMPYISASIIFQLLASVIPALEKLQKEGEAGRRKINQYTRYATVVLCLIQAAIMIGSLRGGRANMPDIFPGGVGPTLLAALLMTAGTLLLMWIGEQIDEFGIGNGISLIIMVNIVSRMPSAFGFLAKRFRFTLEPQPGSELGIQHAALLLALFLFVVVAIVYITQGQRRIPFQQAKQTRGRRVYGGVKHYLPIQVNSAGVIPIIFAQSLLMFPQIFARAAIQKYINREWEINFFYYIVRTISNGLAVGSFVYEALYVALIFFFCYFWTAIQFNPTDMANNLRDHGSFIPGYRPGKRTADYLENVMTRITLPGAAFLSCVAIAPALMSRAMNLPRMITSFYGGTGLLIVVGVALDFVKKVEQQLMLRHYEGFTRGGRRRR